jgi:hypothetical protein
MVHSLLVLNQNSVENMEIQIEWKRRMGEQNKGEPHVLAARTSGTNEIYELELPGVDHLECNSQP